MTYLGDADGELSMDQLRYHGLLPANPTRKDTTMWHEDLTAGTMEIDVYYLACGHITWQVIPPADPPATMHCISCGTDVTMMGHEKSVVVYDDIAAREAQQQPAQN